MSYGNNFKDNDHPYVTCDEPPCACASGDMWVGAQSHTCEYAINGRRAVPCRLWQL